MEEKPIPGFIKPLFTHFILILFLVILNSRVGPLPPLGKFFSPFKGFWRNAEADQTKDLDLRIVGLQEPVTVVFDSRAVPHIFAQNSHDLYLAQGFVTAKDRLWQMEMQTRAAEGTLSEVIGPKMIEMDRFQRRLGIPQAAEKDLELIQKDPEAWEAAESYAQGVNAYIATLSKSQYPLEYKLLDFAPRHWSALNTALMIKSMQWTLSGGGDDLALTNTLSKFGPEFIRKFFPTRESNAMGITNANFANQLKVPPIIPPGTIWEFLSPKQVLPKVDSTNAYPLFPKDNPMPLSPASPASPASPLPVPAIKPDPDNGSNNFVISRSRSQGNIPILANDPHLNLSLPSLWYEVQLSAPGLAVYGVSLPGAPSVLIGFNKKIAWGLTNGHDDVYDWYRISFRDSTLTEYRHDNKWKPIRKEIAVIKVRGADPILDTIFSTHQGPIVLKSQEQGLNKNIPSLHALHWLALEPSDELQSIMQINKSKNYTEFSAALVPFHCPSQNFAFASVDGDIALIHQGLFPRKWKGQGRFILDGSDIGNDWSGWIPQGQEPKSLNPERGWLYSANQTPTDSTYPHYLGNGFTDGERAKRLGQILAGSDANDSTDATDSLQRSKTGLASEKINPENAFSFLLDDYNLHAEQILPTLIKRLGPGPFSIDDSLAIQNLSKWDFHYKKNNTAPALFNEWWARLYQSIWHDEYGEDSLHYKWPSKGRTRELILDEPNSPWFDDITTAKPENLNLLIARSFHQACISAKDPAHASSWKTWAQYRPVSIQHLAHIDAFSHLQEAVDGCSDCVNAQKPSHGPSWRMLVLLDAQPRAYGIYPGGQSGNPGSKHYDDFIADWADGKTYALQFLAEPSLENKSESKNRDVNHLAQNEMGLYLSNPKSSSSPYNLQLRGK